MDDLSIKSVRRWMVRVPVRTPMVWGSGVRTGVTRLVVELETAGGVVGWGETICLLDAIPAVVDRVVIPLAEPVVGRISPVGLVPDDFGRGASGPNKSIRLSCR